MKAYFFDLDGTLTDSRPGLFLSFRAALKAIGIPDLSDRRLAKFLGAPLPEMFHTLCPEISGSQVEIGLEAFRATYELEGITRNHLYPGVLGLLSTIRRRDDGAVWIVTSKPEKYAIQVVAALGLNGLVHGVVGAGLDETDTKTTLIGRTLAAAKVANNAALMIGDRYYDVIGALENNVVPVGALWGYGTYNELRGAGCKFFARSADNFRTHFVEAGFDYPTDRLKSHSTAAIL